MVIATKNDSSIFAAINSFCTFFVAQKITNPGKSVPIAAAVLIIVSSIGHFVLSIIGGGENSTIVLPICLLAEF